MIVLGTNAGAIVSAAHDRLRLGTSGALLSFDEFRVERRADGEASSVMAGLTAYQASDAVHLGMTWGVASGVQRCRLWVDVADSR
jgi:hypothetical protein